jgi:DNA anti-recombination protein RmuC
VKSGSFRFVFLEVPAMDGTPRTMSESRQSFRTPLHILVPKLLQSRAGWKAKSDRRKAQLKAAQITIRDRTASRALWRQRAERLAQENRQLREQLEHATRECRQLQAQLTDQEKKNRPRA